MDRSPSACPKPRARAVGVTLLSLVVVVLTWSEADAATRRVPQDFATIQAAIVAAQDGDTVLVAPGTYFENINFLGKAIEVRSSGGPQVTNIDGALTDVVVQIVSHETTASVLSGFTLTRGLGGAIRMGYQSSATVSGNVLQGNHVCSGAGAIEVLSGGSPVIRDNVIRANKCDPGAGGFGIAIFSGADSSPQILGNLISGHMGGGIFMFSGGTATIQGNTITGNGRAPYGEGGGIAMVNFSNVAIINNLIVGNSAGRGGGISWLVPSGTRGPLIVNNTIAANDSAQGSGLFADGFDVQTLVVNNIIVAEAGQSAIFCGDFNDTNPPIFNFNDVYSASGARYAGICTDQTGFNGNISADPIFVNPSAGDFHLKAHSPAISAGTNSAPNLPVTDKDGGPRVIGGVVDMGAYEYPAVSTPIPTLSERGLISLTTLLALVGILTLAQRRKQDHAEKDRI